MEVAKALGGSFKLVTLAPRTVREMTQLPKETQKNGNKQVFLANHLASTVLVLVQVLNQNNQKTAHIAMKTNNT